MPSVPSARPVPIGEGFNEIQRDHIAAGALA